MYSTSRQIVAGIHVLCLAICTYVAAIEIETILGTAFLCSITGIVLGIVALKGNKKVLALAAFLTPAIALILFVLEAVFLNLGPAKAAYPFCIVFIANQAITTVVILVQMYVDLASKGAHVWRLTIRMLLLLTVSFSAFFAVARILLQRNHNWMMWTALGLLGLTFVGLSMVLLTSFSNRDSVHGGDHADTIGNDNQTN